MAANQTLIHDIRRVDCHVHYSPSAVADVLNQHALETGTPYSKSLRIRPGWTDLNDLRKVMDDTGVDLGLILSTNPLAALRRLGRPMHEATALYNRSQSEDLIAGGRGRFLATALVDPLGGKEELAQLEKSLELPYMAGIGLITSYGEVTLDDPRFEPIFQIARDHDVPVTVHPGGAWPGWLDAVRLKETHFLTSGLGFFLGNAMAIFLMADHGVFDRFPDVRFMFCQLGGEAPWLCCRWWAQSWWESQLEPPLPRWASINLAELLSHLWLDTHTQNRNAMQFVMSEIGDHTIVLGGDYPVTPTHMGVDFAMAEINALKLALDVQRRLERDNALALIGKRALGA